ncbi:MAG: DNA-formamidopyrimidine glycosylase family protein [Saprospiraceae bacterium]
MPELPEVNTFQKYFDAAALSRRIADVDIADDYIIKQVLATTGNTTSATRKAGVLGSSFAERLKGQTFSGSYRRGKYLFGDLDSGHSVLLHFGMTGDLKLYTELEEKPKHERFAFVFEDSQRLGFDDPRKFANIRYLDDREQYVKDIKLGTDALLITKEEFLAKAEGRKTSIKAWLLNQHVTAGVGNLYADEVCYQTRIHPESQIRALSTKQLTDIHKAMVETLTIACDRQAYYKESQANEFWQWRKLEHVSRRGKVLQGVVGGRTTHWVEGWQKLYR